MRPLRHALALVITAVATVLSPLLAAPASAEEPEVAIGLSATQVNPGDSLTVSVTVTNVHAFTVLSATARLFGSPGPLTSYAQLTGCGGAIGSCGTIPGPDGPIGVQASLGSLAGGASATATFTLQIAPDAPGGEQTFQAQLGGANYASEIVDGPVLTIVDRADAAVALTAKPRLSLLVPKIEFTVAVTGNGPGAVRSATVTTPLPAGLSAASGDCAVAAGTVACTVGPLAPGATATRKFTVPIGLLTIGVPYTFTATRTASSPSDPVAANDSARVRCTVVSIVLVTCS
ncbi:hypothetical protein Sme01_37060 [Sphaerisporangium melleum]|uniref:DUF11 domain-containing protein n=1 Tax=Sphaerisporangium melleum TaxID=321316 RepID=A0A917RCQ2_9ACTN|nr:DUF11 domain-containing protein [Sphaerisporangium melleum]GGL00303.1 hypothetical protein GCM10007964_48020 [Sphaerisporangium melleum]GII71230.1 hypothetical protein Sme01_37060 [Sphaerisporangium melleum]